MTDFSDLEAIINGTLNVVMKNATLSYIDLTGDATVDGVLHDSRDEPEAISSPRGVREITFSFTADDLGCLTAGMAVVVRDTDYVISRIESDKTGWVTLHLRGSGPGGKLNATGAGVTGSTFGRHGNRRGHGGS